MKVSKLGAFFALALATPLMTAQAQAASVRPGMVALPSSTAPTGVAKIGKIRAARSLGQQSNLLGAPLFLAFLGAVAVTIGTIVIVNNNNSSSPN